MGERGFTYKLPENFNKRVVQFLQQFDNNKSVEAFQRCECDYEDIGLAYYAGLKGDNWDKRAVDFTVEGLRADISLLKSVENELKSAIGKALKPSVSGYLVRNIFYLDSNGSFENTKILLSNKERLTADIKSANCVLDDLIKIGERMCLNCLLNASSSENEINDYFRDMLFIKGYNEIKDQTRHGVSINGKDAGEVDLLLTKDGKEIAIYEGLKLDSVKKSYINTHIDKAIVNYNALGTPTFIVAYVNSADFGSFWERYFNYVQHYDFPLQIKKPFNLLTHPNAVTRIATVIPTRDGFDFPLYFIAFKLS